MRRAAEIRSNHGSGYEVINVVITFTLVVHHGHFVDGGLTVEDDQITIVALHFVVAL